MMTCPALQTGEQFLGTALAQIDCQAQAIGAYGFGALAGPGSPVAPLLLALLTLFIALFGIKLMLGGAPAGRDVVADMLRLGIVLTLATSWPAWRVLGYDLVLQGPSDLAAAVSGGAGLPGSGGGLNARLQAADDGIVALTMFGSGRLTGGVSASSDLGDAAAGIAMADQAGLGWGRVAFLVGTIAPLALVRLSAGILLAVAPLMAGLLLFLGTRDVFMGWLRSLGACALAAMALSLCYGAELSLLEPWLQSALSQRQANLLTPSAPTELLVVTTAFCLVSFGAVALVMRLMFFASLLPRWELPAWFGGNRAGASEAIEPRLGAAAANPAASRAQHVADAVAQTLRREERLYGGTAPGMLAATPHGAMAAVPAAPHAQREVLGDTFRRSARRTSRAASTRDQTS